MTVVENKHPLGSLLIYTGALLFRTLAGDDPNPCFSLTLPNKTITLGLFNHSLRLCLNVRRKWYPRSFSIKTVEMK